MSRTIYLYVKTHNITGLKYLGKTVKNPFKYNGSGTYWLRHIQKHGNNVSTQILFETDDHIEFEKIGIYYSNLYNIVESEEWANMTIENGKGGTLSGEKNGMYGRTHSETVKKFLGEKAKKRFKNKSYESLYGKEKANELKLLRSKQLKGIDRKGNKNSRFDSTEYVFFNCVTNEYHIGTRYSFYKKYNFNKSTVHKLIHDEKYIYKNWAIKR
jgi:hypothetical protein